MLRRGQSAEDRCVGLVARILAGSLARTGGSPFADHERVRLAVNAVPDDTEAIDSNLRAMYDMLLRSPRGDLTASRHLLDYITSVDTDGGGGASNGLERMAQRRSRCHQHALRLAFLGYQPAFSVTDAVNDGAPGVDIRPAKGRRPAVAPLDDDVAEMDVGLVCRLSQARIQLPARGVMCTHLDCFDLRAAIEAAIVASPIGSWSSRPPTWKCSCGRVVVMHPKHVDVDWWLWDVLLQSEMSAAGVAQAVLSRDGGVAPRAAARRPAADVEEVMSQTQRRPDPSAVARWPGVKEEPASQMRPVRLYEEISDDDQHGGLVGRRAASGAGADPARALVLSDTTHPNSSATTTAGASGRPPDSWDAAGGGNQLASMEVPPPVGSSFDGLPAAPGLGDPPPCTALVGPRLEDLPAGQDGLGDPTLPASAPAVPPLAADSRGLGAGSGSSAAQSAVPATPPAPTPAAAGPDPEHPRGARPYCSRCFALLPIGPEAPADSGAPGLLVGQLGAMLERAVASGMPTQEKGRRILWHDHGGRPAPASGDVECRRCGEARREACWPHVLVGDVATVQTGVCGNPCGVILRFADDDNSIVNAQAYRARLGGASTSTVASTQGPGGGGGAFGRDFLVTDRTPADVRLSALAPALRDRLEFISSETGVFLYDGGSPLSRVAADFLEAVCCGMPIRRLDVPLRSARKRLREDESASQPWRM